jgi:hypothetical protein
MHFKKILYFAKTKCLCVEAGTAGLNGINLSLSPGETAEAGGKLSAVEELAVLGLDGAERGTRLATDGAGGGGATERTVLLSLGAVGSKRIGESAGGRGGVDARRVVDGLWNTRLASRFKGFSESIELSRTRDRTLANEANERGASGTAEDGGGTHCGGSYMGCEGGRLVRSI